MTDGFPVEFSITPQQRLADLRAATARVEAARATESDTEIETAVKQLRNAVDDARDADIAWGAIGDALGITRGNACQRYRRRPGQ